MLTDQHAQPPDEHDPPPDEHDPPPCDCGGCREFRAIHAGFRAELSERERRAKRINDRAAQIRWNESAAGFGDAAPYSKAS